MVAIHPEFIVDEKARKKGVVVPFHEWQSLMKDLAELEDIRAYDHAKAKRESILPFEMAVHQIKAKARK